MKHPSILLLILAAIFLTSSQLHAKEIFLKNGDKVTGEIVKETKKKIIVQTQAFGKVSVDKEFVDYGLTDDVEAIVEDIFLETEKVPQDEKSKWSRKISLGYSQASGNTEASQFSGKFDISRKLDHAEWSGKLHSYISSANEKMDAKKFNGMLRYAFSFGQEYKWYNFYKFEGNQDRFANVNYRLIPSAGVGYWFSDEEEWKAMIEGALGFEHTNYRDGTENENQVVFVPRAFFEKVLFDDLKVSQDITMYPSLEEFEQFRLHSETSLINPLSEHIEWRLSFIDDYNSKPSGSAEKNDFRLISSIDYAF